VALTKTEKNYLPQVIPAFGPLREELREKGQFWTPQWLANAMAKWVTANHPEVLFDPAVGPGTFFSAARSVGFKGDFAGFELDGTALEGAYKRGLNFSEMKGIQIGDFIQDKIRNEYPAIISNPPYIRHHRLNLQQKLELRQLATNFLGFPLDGRMGLHIYFLLKSLRQLASNGRLAFLLPADVCEGVSSTALWKKISEHFRIDAVINFDNAAAPFPSLDTNVILFLISNRSPAPLVVWSHLLAPKTEAVLDGVYARNSQLSVTHKRDIFELLATGLSRPPRINITNSVPLSAFARVMRGIATGANNFFFLTSDQVQQFDINKNYFKRAIGRTRDCRKDKLELADLRKLDNAGRPTWLLNIGKQRAEDLPASLRKYIEMGERWGLHQKPLIKTRRPWYRMEQRIVPGILFAYLGRRDCRFIENTAEALPLTGFLCIYPWDPGVEHRQKLCRALNHPLTIANLVFVGKSYGKGAIKVEPRRLDALEIPCEVLEEIGLKPIKSHIQPILLEKTRR
jgi:hypothetical protein